MREEGREGRVVLRMTFEVRATSASPPAKGHFPVEHRVRRLAQSHHMPFLLVSRTCKPALVTPEHVDALDPCEPGGKAL